jgi:thiol-disulfide isomerase/thioredoxin
MKIIKFGATWCGPCKTQDREMEDLPEYMKFRVEKYDVDEIGSMELAKRYGVRGVPCMILVDDSDNEITRLSGLHMSEEIEEKIGKYFVH